MKKIFLLNFSAVAILLLTPTVSFAQVVINEIAWMGTSASPNGSYCEWIELYNTKDTEVYIDGWVIKIGTTEKIFSSDTNATLSIGPNSFYLIERYTPSACPDPVPGVDADWSVSFGNGISNNGTIIILENASGFGVDKVDMSEGWTAGDPVTKDTAQRLSSGNWTTAVPTPKAVNSYSSSDINAGSGSGSSASSLSATSGAAEPTYATAVSKLEVSAGGDRLTSPGSPISFQAEIKKNSVSNSAVGFSWSFGDGYVGEGALVSHTYRYPGQYAVVLNSKAGNNFAVSRLKVRVIEPDITLVRAEPGQGDFIEIANNSAYELNLFNWKIVDDHQGFVFQPDTIILPKSKLRFDRSLLKMRGEAEENLVLKNHLGQVVASAPKKMSESELKEIAAKTVDVQKQTYELAEKVRIMSPALAVQTKITEKTVPEEKAEEAPSEPENNLLYEAPKSEGIFVRLTNFVKRVIFR